jgi:5-methylcytosine-specific restriction enzyme A
MARAKRLCSSCPTVIPRSTRNRCDECERKAEQARGTSTQRGYGTTHRKVFRQGVLARHPFCQYPRCTASSTDADHWPLSRRELVDAGLDPDDPRHGRGLCHEHHSGETAVNQPGGWHANRQP